MTDDEGNIHELGTNTFGLIGTQSEEEIRELVSGLTQSATGKRSWKSPSRPGGNGIATENKMVLGNNQSVVCVSSCFTPHSCANLMIWQTTWERHHVAGNPSSLSEQLGEGEIELRNELPGGEVHAAWHLRYAGHDFFVKCDERELLPGFTAEADQLELLSRSKTVTVPKVWAVGADRDYSFLVMDYLPPRPLDAHSAFILVSKLRVYINGGTNHNLASILITRSPQLHSPTPQRRWSTFLLNNGLAGSWNWQQRKGSLSAISTPSSSIFSSVWPRINRSLLCCTAIYGPATVRWVRWPVHFRPCLLLG